MSISVDKIARERKYKIFWGSFVITTFLLIFDKITGDQWVTMGGTIFTVYMLGNVGAKFSNRGKTDVG